MENLLSEYRGKKNIPIHLSVLRVPPGRWEGDARTRSTVDLVARKGIHAALSRRPQMISHLASLIFSLLSAGTHTWATTVAFRTRDVNRCYVVHRARMYASRWNRWGTCARERNRTRALGECTPERKRERKTEEEQEAGVFRDVVCAVYANWARVNARDAQDGI